MTIILDNDWLSLLICLFVGLIIGWFPTYVYFSWVARNLHYELSKLVQTFIELGQSSKRINVHLHDSQLDVAELLDILKTQEATLTPQQKEEIHQIRKGLFG